ncbi:MAG: tetratricopeptide repeat protein [Prolixibacteraceae bacterium]|nr:tetratricopeptide repeat protein [Prolixibacteraceae bacterium]
MKKFCLFLGTIVISIAALAQTEVDSLLNLTEKATEKQKSGLYLELSFFTREDTAKSNSYSRMAYQLAVKHKQLLEQARSFYYLGETDFYAREYIHAIPSYEKAKTLFEQLKDTFYLTNCYSSVGLCYHNMDQGEKAIEQFIEGLKLCDRNQEYAAELLHNIGNVHHKMENEKEAISYFKKAKNINIQIGDSVSLAVTYNGIGNSFISLNQADSAVLYLQKANQLFGKLNQSGYQAIALANLGTIYTDYPDSLEKAYYAFNQAWAKFQELGWNQYEAEIKEGLGDILSRQGKYKEAIEFYNESLRLTEHFDRGFGLKKSTYQKIATTYSLIGDYKSALKNHILFAQYSDSLSQKEKYEKLVSIEKQYETEKKENEIIRLHAKQELLDIQLSKNKQLKQLGFIAATLLLVLVFFVLVKYFEKLKSNELLEEKNQIIEKSEQELRLLNAAKNKFFSIIAHDLKNPFHNVMGYSYLLSKDYDKFTEEERKRFAKDINQSTTNIFRLLQNLLEWARSQTGRLTFLPLEIELKKLLSDSINVHFSMAEQKNITISLKYDEELKVFADPLMIETVLRNLINNAIKFTPENGEILVTAKQNQNEVEVCIADNGVGISETDCLNLFRIDSKVKRKGTNDEDGSGLGLILCKEFVHKNNGSIWVKSAPDQGSSFFFTIPVQPMT